MQPELCNVYEGAFHRPIVFWMESGNPTTFNVEYLGLSYVSLCLPSTMSFLSGLAVVIMRLRTRHTKVVPGLLTVYRNAWRSDN